MSVSHLASSSLLMLSFSFSASCYLLSATYPALHRHVTSAFAIKNALLWRSQLHRHCHFFTAFGNFNPLASEKNNTKMQTLLQHCMQAGSLVLEHIGNLRRGCMWLESVVVLCFNVLPQSSTNDAVRPGCSSFVPSLLGCHARRDPPSDFPHF